MKKLFVLALAVVIMLAMAYSAFAVVAGKTVEYTPKGADKVVFEGKNHAGKGLKCTDCHSAIFQMKKGANPMTMKDMEAGKGCGTCHNGKKAFSVADKAACGKCHKK